LLALAAAVGGIAALAAGPRAEYLFFDGNSVFLELVHRSFAAGLAPEWVSSAALFFFPEIPVYELVRAVTGTAQWGILVNGFAYLAGLYVLLRVVAAQLWSPRRAIVSALVPFLLLCLALGYGVNGGRDSVQLVSDLLFGDYYAGTTLAMIGSVALVAAFLRNGRRWMAAALVVLGAVSTASNPLYVLWTSVPLGIALLALVIGRRAPLRAAVVIAGTAVVGPVLGVLARIPLARFISAPTDRYIHPNGIGDSATFYAGVLLELVGPGGIGELIVVLAFAAASVAGIVLVARGRLAPAAAVVALFGALSMPVAFAVNIALGTQTVRYLQPMFFGQALALVVVVGHAVGAQRVRAIWPGLAPSRRCALAALAIVVSTVIVVVGGAGAATLPAAARQQPADLACLEAWADGRDATGVGTFWTVRTAKAYGNSDVRLVQVDDQLELDPWLVNLAEYRDLEASYVLLGPLDQPELTASIERVLGEPAARAQCGDYRILDYEGTAAAAVLSERVGDSALAEARARGFTR
jgi:hypothetical protein